MGCIRIERILDYVIEPLRRGIRDSSPYVRKTSALCIAKIFDLNAEISEDCGFLESLQELLMTDSNPMVISNVVAALSDIQELCPDLEALNLNDEIVLRLIEILGDCTEWGQVFLMDILADYDGNSMKEIEKLVETVIPKLQHANQAVVMSAINVLVKKGLESKILPENHQFRVVIMRKLSSPLISILSPPNPPELQYAALRNVNLLVQSYPKLFGSELNVFFCSYNDPQYVKLEKLEIIGKIVDDSSVNRIISELCEYAKDVDGEIVKKSIKILNQCALNVPRWSRRICEIFLELLQTQLPIVLQQVTINLKSLFRNQMTRNEFFPLLESFYFVNLDGTWNGLYGDVDSQSSFIWILGEFCNPESFEEEKLNEILRIFVEISEAETFKLEGVEFQSELIISAIKIFIKNEKNHENLLRKILSRGIEEGESLDLRDRCKIFERIFNSEIGRLRKRLTKNTTPSTALQSSSFGIDDWNLSSEDGGGINISSSSLCEDELVLEGLFNCNDENSDDFLSLEESTGNVNVLLKQLTKLSSIYHQLPSEFVSARVIMKDSGVNVDIDDDKGVDDLNETRIMSPLEQSLKSLLIDNVDNNEMPRAWTKLLRQNRPAVANLLDLSYNNSAITEPLKISTSTSIGDSVNSPKTPKEKYANLLDLLD